jgi:hypothetical protein
MNTFKNKIPRHTYLLNVDPSNFLRKVKGFSLYKFDETTKS